MVYQLVCMWWCVWFGNPNFRDPYLLAQVA